MSQFVIACYSPKPGKEQELLSLVQSHVPSLQRLDMVTPRPPLVLRNRDGVIVELFEWRSEDALEDAHLSPEVQEIWKQFDEVSDYKTLNHLPESKELFAQFELVEIR